MPPFATLRRREAPRMQPCPFPLLKGESVQVRPLRMDDAEALTALRGDPRTARYQSWSKFVSADAEALIASAGMARVDIAGAWAQGAIARLIDDRLIGDCCVRCPVGAPRQCEIGFNLMTAERGRGFAAEAVSLLVDWLINEREKQRIFAITDRRNQPSRRLLARIGFHAVPEQYRLVYFKHEWEGETVYERLAGR